VEQGALGDGSGGRTRPRSRQASPDAASGEGGIDMAQLPDVFCWIKVIDDATGKVVPNGKDLGAPGKAIVRYVVANDSNQVAGPLTIVGSLYRDGVKVAPSGQSQVVPAQQITLQPNQVWKKEYAVSEGGKGLVSYSARLLGDVGGAVNEEDESNNKAQQAFGFLNIT
jgi:hypothetical protein